MIYIVTVSRTEKTCEERFENLSQIYGYLCGKLDTYRKFFPTFKTFRRWWGIRRRREKRGCPIELSMQGATITIISQ